MTAEDFETLALRSSTGVARAKCLPSQKHDGEVQVVIVPRGDEKNLDLTKRLVAAPELLRFVKNYLDERRLVGTVLEVIKPGYVEISLKVTLVRRTVGQSDRVKREIEDRLRRYLHPLVGGRDGKGWTFGRAVYKTDLAHLVEDVPGRRGHRLDHHLRRGQARRRGERAARAVGADLSGQRRRRRARARGDR